MIIIENISDVVKKRGCVLALGNFDGVHIGHVHLLNRAGEYAKKNGLDFGVFTFIDSPKFLNPGHSLLTDLQTRISMIQNRAEPDFLYLEKFENVKDFSPEKFVEYIASEFNCVCAFSGENFCFGKSALGKADDLKRLMNEIGRDAIVVESVYDNGELISSTIIRSLLASGDVMRAERLLGKPYGFVSKVVHGAHLGHTLGFPTINQIIPKELICPKYGVYSTIVIVDGKEYAGVTNFGVKPTVSKDNTPVAETYIIDFDGDVYGKEIGVFFCKMLREEKKFSSLEELKENIAMNVKQTRVFFKEKYEKK